MLANPPTVYVTYVSLYYFPTWNKPWGQNSDFASIIAYIPGRLPIYSLTDITVVAKVSRVDVA